MSNEGLNYLYRNLRFPADAWKIFYDFNSGAGLNVPSISGGDSQFSGILSLQTNLNLFGGSVLTGSFAADQGQLYQNTLGFSLGLRKNFSL